MRKDVRFTEEQMRELSKWEGNLGTAVRADWSRGIGAAATRRMNEIYNEATGGNMTINVNCAGCVLSLMRDVGKIYFKTKEALKTQKNGEEKQTKRKTRKNIAKGGGEDGEEQGPLS